MPSTPIEVDVAIIGGGQSALAVAYFLRRTGRSFVIIDSVDAASNAPMRDLAKALGFETHNDPDDTRQVIHRLYL